MKKSFLLNWVTNWQNKSLMNLHYFITQNKRQMSYTQKISFFIWVSFIAHLCVLSIFTKIPTYKGIISSIPKAKTINIEFVKQEPQKSTKKLVEVVEPTDEIPSKTENIGEFNSISSGPIKKDGDTHGPPLIENEKIETLGSEHQKIQIANVIPTPEKQSKTKSVDSIRKRKESSHIDVIQKGQLKTTPPKQEEPPKERDTLINKESPEKIVAPEYLPNTFTKPQGKIYNQVKKEGILGFEALQDQLAPYLKEIQRKVEKYWIHYLLTRYSGTKPTEVLIDCEISSEGNIVKLDIIGNPEDPLFAGICKQALQKSAPFSPFPFQVPDIYQNKNLQIRWTFSFM